MPNKSDKGVKECAIWLAHLQMVPQSVETKVGSTMVMASIKETSKPWRPSHEKKKLEKDFD
jgi:hypothetical protein